MKVTLKCEAKFEWDAEQRVINVTIPNNCGMQAIEFHKDENEKDTRSVKQATVCFNSSEDLVTTARFLLQVRELY